MGGADPGLRRPPGAGRVQPAAGPAPGRAVKQFLVELGVPETSIKVVTIGQEGALCDDPVAECQQLNRRVHLEIRKLAPAARLRSGRSSPWATARTSSACGEQAMTLASWLGLLVRRRPPALGSARRRGPRRVTEGTLLWRTAGRGRPAGALLADRCRDAGDGDRRPRHGPPGVHESQRRVGGGRLRVPAAGGRRGRPPADARGRPDHRGRHPERAAAEGRPTSRREQQGRRASLVEQERPNIFTTSVANIPPGAAIAVEIEYQQAVRYDAGAVPPALPDGGRPALHPGRAAAGDRDRPGAGHGPGSRRLAHHAAGAASGRRPAQPGQPAHRARPGRAAGRRGVVRTTRSRRRR